MISSQGLDFVVRHEGFVSQAYRDPVGVWTVGTGFTNGSGVAVEMLGRIGPGRTVTRAQSDRVLSEAFAREYGPPVDQAMPGGKQHERDAGYSYCFNCGPAAMGDRWVGLWRTGAAAQAGERLAVSRVTAKGKRLRGLVNRRAAEARLLTTGQYGAEAPARDAPADYRRKLRDLGYDSVIAFQKHHPHLVDDGILGPATRAQIDRDAAARKEGAGVGTGAAIGVGLAAWLAANGHVLAIAAGLAIAALVAWFVLRRREEITHWIANRKG
jgi:GH24 family phage-related lysozyme (muramidase)